MKKRVIPLEEKWGRVKGESWLYEEGERERGKIKQRGGRKVDSAP